MSGERPDDGIAIDLATREDVPAIYDMLCALSETLDKADAVHSTPDDIARYGFGPSPAFETMLARQGGVLVGLALFFYEFSTWRGRPGVYVQDLYVAAGMRGTGLGRRLLSAVAARAAARNATYMRLSVNAGNDEGTAFYERIGFNAPQEQILVLEGPEFAAMSRNLDQE